MKSRRLPLRRLRQATLGIAALALPFVPGVQAEPAVVDGVAALVNGDLITFSEVRLLVGPREASLRSNYSGPELAAKIKEVRQGALQDLIDRKLILQEFKKKEFQIPPHLIDEHVDTIVREKFGGDRQAFIRTLQAEGFTMSKFREAEREKIIVQAMRFQNTKTETLPPPSKLTELYNTKKADYTTPEQVHLWMISLTKGTGLAAGETDPQKALAEEVRAKVAGGGKFDQLAQLYSVDSSRQNGGDWGWVDRKTLNDTLTNAAFRLDAGKVSPVVQQGNYYYILRVTEKKSAVTKPFSEVRPDLEGKMSSEIKSRRQDLWLASLRSKAFIKTF